MFHDITINEDFVKNLLKRLCNYRSNGNFNVPPYCQFKTPLSLKLENNNIEWGYCVKCIGSCFVGDVDKIKSWTSTRRRRRLVNCINSSINIDWLLHLSKKRYRDHSSHQLFVGVLGWFLLECEIKTSNNTKSKTLKQWISEKSNLKEEEVEIAWWLTSLLHDHAYPLEQILKVVPSVVDVNRDILLDQIWSLLGYSPHGEDSNPLSEIFKDLYHNKFLVQLRKAATQASQELRTKEIRRILNDCLIKNFFETHEICQSDGSCYDHGILGAANISSLLEKPDESPILKSTIRAIGIHNGAACSERVDIMHDPLAFLLILCDQSQEWDRRILVEDEIFYESNCIQFRGLSFSKRDVYQLVDKLIIVFEYPDASCLLATDWDYSLFKKSKEKSFSRLNIFYKL